MLNQLFNFSTLIKDRKIKKNVEKTDLMVLGTVDKRYLGNYQPVIITADDFAKSISKISAKDEFEYFEFRITDAMIVAGTPVIVRPALDAGKVYLWGEVILETVSVNATRTWDVIDANDIILLISNTGAAIVKAGFINNLVATEPPASKYNVVQLVPSSGHTIATALGEVGAYEVESLMSNATDRITFAILDGTTLTPKALSHGAGVAPELILKMKYKVFNIGTNGTF